MNIILIVVDSLRAQSLRCTQTGGPRTPFFDRLASESLCFRSAYATECWTLPTHMSMFTGLLPSEHGAHFQTMAYGRPAKTAAELLAEAGYHTEVVTRNSLFDGTVPGATRGFRVNTRVFAELDRAGPFSIVLALAKPRVRRLIETSGFFSLLQKQNRDFVTTLARMGIPADQRVLDYLLEHGGRLRRQGTPFFFFANLYDVHAPYAPSLHSPLRSFGSLSGCLENLSLPLLLPRVSSHAYLRPKFRMSPRGQRTLLSRYHRAIELIDEKLAAFYDGARTAGLLDDTLLIITADHGEAFGDHELYFHDASVYDTHLHVPLWIHHPALGAAQVDDVVSTRDLFTLLSAVGLQRGLRGTILDPAARAANPVALAEHFHYPHTAGLLPRYVQNIAAAVVGERKLIARREGLEHYDLAHDPDETAPQDTSIAAFADACRCDGVGAAAIAAAIQHLGVWEQRALAA